jgi:hypothetical protein
MAEKDGTLDGVEEVSGFIRAAYQFQKQHADTVFFCPLTIDELPFRLLATDPSVTERLQTAPPEGWDAVDDDNQPLRFVTFPRDDAQWERRAFRWPVSYLCATEECLAPPAPEPQIPFPLKQIEDVGGNIYTDVSFRDFRYVEQSGVVTVFNPLIRPGRTSVSRSVLGEINYAVGLHKRVFVYQDPERDRSGVAKRDILQGDPGTMVSDPSRLRKRFVDSPEALLKSIS